MSTAAGTTGTGSQTRAGGKQPDAAESMLQTMDETTEGTTGVSLFHILTIASIGASVALFLSGKKQAGLFVGLWPPTFQALKSVVERKKKA
jgi:hypothetical protein